MSPYRCPSLFMILSFLSRHRRVLFDRLARTAGLRELEERIVFEQALTPQDIRDRYHGLASHGRFLGALKPGNHSRDLEGPYLAGGGPGMPMVLMSGWIAADALDSDRPAATAA